MKNLDSLAVRAQTDESAKAELMREVRPLVRNAVYRITGSGSTLSKEDLYQQGFVGVLEALPKYDPSKGSFTTFIYRPVQEAMTHSAGDYYHGLSVPKSSLDRYRQARAATSSLSEAREYARGLGMTGETFDATHAAITGVWHTSRLTADGDEGALDIPDASVNFPDWVVNRQAVTAALGCLTNQEREVVELSYGFYDAPKTDGEVAKAVGLPRSTVQHTRKRAVKRLMSNLKG